MATLLYPISVELTRIEQQKLPVLTLNDPLFTDIFPIRSKDVHLVEWEQEDNYVGLMEVRGLDGAPSRVKAVGMNRYQAEPGVYGEYMIISEKEITTRAGHGAARGIPVDVSDLVMMRSEQLMTRQLQRMRQIGWDLVTTGRFSSTNAAGAVIHTDSYRQRRLQSTVAWSTPGTSTPIADFKAAQLLARGTSSSFGATARAYMNRTTANWMLANTNAADLGGKRTNGLANILSISDYNRLAAGDDLPEIVIYDEGYHTDAGVHTLFLADGIVQIVGRRQTGVPIGAWTMTRNAQNPNLAPGPYYQVTPNRIVGEPPLRIDRGFNGAVELHFPGSLLTMVVN